MIITGCCENKAIFRGSVCVFSLFSKTGVQQMFFICNKKKVFFKKYTTLEIRQDLLQCKWCPIYWSIQHQHLFVTFLDPLHSQVRWASPADSLHHVWRFSPLGFHGHLSNSRLCFPSHGFHKDMSPPRDVHCSPNRHGIETFPQHFQVSHPSSFFIHTLH